MPSEEEMIAAASLQKLGLSKPKIAPPRAGDEPVYRDLALVVETGALVVAVAQLAWSVYNDLSKSRSSLPDRDDMWIELCDRIGKTDEEVIHIIRVVIETTFEVIERKRS